MTSPATTPETPEPTDPGDGGAMEAAASARNVRKLIPGPREARIAEMIRVDHAGEYGAVQIYRGQRAVFEAVARDGGIVEELQAMEEGEQHHLDTFDALIAARGVRPTALAPLWNAAGFALGAATALLGERAAMACTTAVEEVIEEHYAAQADELDGVDDGLKATVEAFRADEIEHKETALAAGAKDAFAYPLLAAGIKSACRLAIRLSEKV